MFFVEVSSRFLSTKLLANLIRVTELKLKTNYQWKPLQIFQISPAHLDKWVRHRAKANGAPKLSGVYVSSRKDLGITNLLAFIKELAGPRGNMWVIGAQNAGKSILINAFAKKGGVKATKLTEAPVPGTTLGILRIGGILSAKAKMYDTSGLLHPYLMSMLLNREEQKMVEIRKKL
ncbi:GTP-binding protein BRASSINAZOLE INSENSITIVE PALE GREEN 2, chloroplastic [Datura stramonium]|uniref:GTP-binding protein BRASSINAZOLE INSENSITIVE PALE GREEN 2, chloroplastic n=1 Tax=Datura stramonium TaxID=4076 RepID=A0ABS8SDY5_DATST|nr:GTP-binding protein BRASSINAZOLE INSENSITIVE PALE GREEN 2, chloroplastic [Datura stramonium]